MLGPTSFSDLSTKDYLHYNDPFPVIARGLLLVLVDVWNWTFGLALGALCMRRHKLMLVPSIIVVENNSIQLRGSYVGILLAEGWHPCRAEGWHPYIPFLFRLNFLPVTCFHPFF